MPRREPETPAERSLRARLAIHTRWSQTVDRSAATEPARRAQRERFERQVDPDGSLPAEVRGELAEHARRAHLLRMSLAAAQARRARRARAAKAANA